MVLHVQTVLPLRVLTMVNVLILKTDQSVIAPRTGLVQHVSLETTVLVLHAVLMNNALIPMLHTFVNITRASARHVRITGSVMKLGLALFVTAQVDGREVGVKT